jgi:hypothetical protein
MTIKLYKHERNPDHVTDVRLSLCLCFCCLVLPVKEFGGFVLNLKYFSAAIALVADWQIILQSWKFECTSARMVSSRIPPVVDFFFGGIDENQSQVFER